MSSIFIMKEKSWKHIFCTAKERGISSSLSFIAYSSKIGVVEFLIDFLEIVCGRYRRLSLILSSERIA